MLGKVTKYEHKRTIISKVMEKSMGGGTMCPSPAPPPPHVKWV